MSNNQNRNQQLAADQAMIDGIQKFLMQFALLPVGSQILAPADIVKVFQDRLNAGKAVVTAEAARAAAVKGNRDERSKTSAFAQAFRRMVLGMFSESPDTLATFNLTAAKVARKTVATKATAVAKSMATREARGTMGKKQKAKIKGTLPEASTAPATPAPTATSGTAPEPATAAPKPNAP